MIARSWNVQVAEVPIECGLMLFCGLVYFSQGLSCGLLAQPFTYYLKSQGMAADTITAFFAVAALPWMIKRLRGYRRKTYLTMTAGLATIGLLGLSQFASPDVMVWACLSPCWASRRPTLLWGRRKHDRAPHTFQPCGFGLSSASRGVHLRTAHGDPQCNHPR